MKALSKLSALLLIPFFVFLAACGSDGGDGPDGNSSVSGQVRGFAGAIQVEGTSLKTTVSDGEPFAFSGVPSGQRTLVFTQGSASGLAEGESARMALNVPSNARIDLGQVQIAGNTAVPSQVRVEIFASDDDDDNGNDDNGNDDNGNDDDDNGNDDDDDDDDNRNS